MSYGATATAVLNVVVTTEAEQVELTPRPCSEEGSLKTIADNVPSTIQLNNYTDQLKRSYFLDYNGQRSSSYDLPGRGGGVIWFGWINMAFVITDSNDNCVGIYVIERRPGRGTTGARADFSANDQRFAPSVERFNFSYTVKAPSTRPPSFAKFEVFKNGDSTTPIYRDESIARTGIDIQYQQSGTVGWDGKMNQGAESGNYIEPKHSPLTIRLSTASQANYSDAAKDEKTLEVEIHSIALTPSGATKVYKPNRTATEIDKPIEALIKLKKKDGTGVVTAIPLKLKWSFEDPDDTAVDSTIIDTNGTIGDDNALASKNGKRGDLPNSVLPGVMWKVVPGFPAVIASDGQSAEAITQITGAKIGKTKINFSTSVIGGDNYLLIARYQRDDGTLISEKKTGAWSVWKRLNFTTSYRMSGGADVRAIMSVANINPAFSGDGYTEYALGTTQNFASGAQSPQFIGDVLLPNASELPQAGDTPAQIEAKAQAWYERNILAPNDGLQGRLLNYIATNNIPAYSVIGGRYFHPRLDGNVTTGYPVDPNTGLSDFYPPGTRVTRIDVPGGGAN